MNLRKLAENQPCFVRLPAICNGRTDTTVLAHIKNGWCGSIKPPDIIGVFACFDCHNAIDGRSRPKQITRAEIDLAVFRALCEQLSWYTEQKILKW